MLLLALVLAFVLIGSSTKVKTFWTHYRNWKLCSAIAICLYSSSPVSALVNFEPSDKSYTFAYPDDFQLAPKLLKTHNKETFLKSTTVSGFNAGITVSSSIFANVDLTILLSKKV